MEAIYDYTVTTCQLKLLFVKKKNITVVLHIEEIVNIKFTILWFEFRFCKKRYGIYIDI